MTPAEEGIPVGWEDVLGAPPGQVRRVWRTAPHPRRICPLEAEVPLRHNRTPILGLNTSKTRRRRLWT
jgi:hypothetical protein